MVSPERVKQNNIQKTSFVSFFCLTSLRDDPLCFESLTRLNQKGETVDISLTKKIEHADKFYSKSVFLDDLRLSKYRGSLEEWKVVYVRQSHYITSFEYLNVRIVFTVCLGTNE